VIVAKVGFFGPIMPEMICANAGLAVSPGRKTIIETKPLLIIPLYCGKEKKILRSQQISYLYR
jgi:hypothetical protein